MSGWLYFYPIGGYHLYFLVEVSIISVLKQIVLCLTVHNPDEGLLKCVIEVNFSKVSQNEYELAIDY